MITEVDVDDIGTVRVPNMWQQVRIRQVRGPNRHVARLAFACGMTVKQFKRLPADKQEEIRQALLAITSPRNV